MESLGTALPKEMARVGELLGIYRSIGPAGAFGALMMEQSLKAAEEAIAAGSLVATAEAYEDLRTYKE